MNRRIYKYPLSKKTFVLELPLAHRIIYVDLQDGEPTMWIELDLNSDVQEFTFAILGTGHPIPDNYTYIQTFQQPPFVWHLFSVNK